MAPKKTGKDSATQAKADIMHSDATTQDASQDIDTKTLQELLNQHKQQVKLRRQERNETIMAAHKARIAKLRKDVDDAFAQHEETVRAIRRPKMERLLGLVRKKRKLEQEMNDCVSHIEAVFKTTSDKVQIAIDARLDAISS